jgi:hypothetical protein
MNMAPMHMIVEAGSTPQAAPLRPGSRSLRQPVARAVAVQRPKVTGTADSLTANAGDPNEGPICVCVQHHDTPMDSPTAHNSEGARSCVARHCSLGPRPLYVPGTGQKPSNALCTTC